MYLSSKICLAIFLYFYIMQEILKNNECEFILFLCRHTK
jgi:hypothetical protein